MNFKKLKKPQEFGWHWVLRHNRPTPKFIPASRNGEPKAAPFPFWIGDKIDLPTVEKQEEQA